MNKEAKKDFVAALRVAVQEQLPQVRDMEMYKSNEMEAFDAFGVLCATFMMLSPRAVCFIPVSRAGNEYYFYDREEMIAWSGISQEEIEELIEMNDVLGLDFGAIADAVENQWQ